ncbi:hypothetical protein FA95DRAFT_1258418 [Auriscalpium vulgare]|uniref:Uncharacterized protein n=1 Tax=Auriscalpium vulgare TaxID=40419 RepID=A0ACB8SA05_9AGAM|nr:hypothetical protein FA95DRAFT_1258418 [Auriscalpium vulgare]
MATLQDRPFSKDYSGLINQSVIAGSLMLLLFTAHEVMKRKRRGKAKPGPGLGTVETWEFGYLYQGRSWAKNPSPPSPNTYPLAWVQQVLKFPDDDINELRGVDAALYIRFLRGCTWFAFLHTCTTMPILLPIHLHFSDDSFSPPRSMTRASISALVTTGKGKSLLWIHLILLFWVTFTWIFTLLWICRGAFLYRRAHILAAAERAASANEAERQSQYHPHPHPQFPFQAVPTLDDDKSNRGLRLRTVMVTNLPLTLRSEKELAEYFQYYLSRPIEKPAVAITSSVQPGFVNKSAGFLFNRAKHIPEHLPHLHRPGAESSDLAPSAVSAQPEPQDVPVISRVVIARKLTELAARLEKREEILRRLETAHIGLARRVLLAVKRALDEREGVKHLSKRVADYLKPSFRRLSQDSPTSKESQAHADMDLLISAMQPFIEEFGLRGHPPKTSYTADPNRRTIWEALNALPRRILQPYQPLFHLSTLFRGKTVPAIDYYTAKLTLLSTLITENRSHPPAEYAPVSTAFVTFATPKDARRACKYLAVHPNNPLTCVVSMAPSYEDLDWTRIMKSTYKAEFIKDWVVNVGVWVFTLAWLFPVSLFVTLVSIQNISAFWPGLYHYLQHHPWEEELIQSFLPTLLVSLLTLLIPVLLLLIAKKAHTIVTLSELHDRIMTRYYKFLIVNVLVFFCVGTATLQSFLVSFASKGGKNILNIVASSFPSAGPFYVGWLIFTTGIHASLEIALFGLPLFMYPSTMRQVTPRKRNVRIRPRTFNYYYWLPNHLLIIHVLLLFSVLNPLVIPFAWIYFIVDKTVIKNQLIHVYAKNYEGNGRTILIRLIRYSLDGLVLAQAVFLAYMAVLRKEVNVALSGVLIVFTVVVKVVMTRLCRAKLERDDLLEANIICGQQDDGDSEPDDPNDIDNPRRDETDLERALPGSSRLWKTWRLSTRFPFSYATFPRPHRALRRPENPFPLTNDKGVLKDAAETRTAEFSPSGRKTSKAALNGSVLNGNATNGDKLPLTAIKIRTTNVTLPPLVSPHALHPTWDDESDVGHPYDNPYYSQPISSTLWLPRDPCGVLNLDDTVDVRTSLTTTVSVDALLEAWAAAASPIDETPLQSVTPDDPTRQNLLPLPRRLSGNEDIQLPSQIASRINALPDIDIALEPRASIFGQARRASRSSFGTNLTGSSWRRRMRDINSSTDGTSRIYSERHFRGSQTSVGFGQPLGRALTHDPGVGLRTEGRARIAFASTSALPLGYATQDVELGLVTSQEAVVEEAIVEERQDVEDRRREEHAEAQQQMKEHPWWSRWFFAKAS